MLLDSYISSNDFQNSMIDLIDQIVVKVSPKLDHKNQLTSVQINNFKDYTSRYFKKSSSPFLSENEFYVELTESLKGRLVKDYLT